MRRTLVEIFTRQHEPLSRVEMWLGIITLYLVIGAFLMGHFSARIGAAKQSTIVPITNRA